MPSGVVVSWIDEKGFGFIKPDDEGEDLFVHRTALNGCDALEKGDEVTFDITVDDRSGKDRAINVEGGTGVRRDDRDGGGGGRGGGRRRDSRSRSRDRRRGGDRKRSRSPSDDRRGGRRR
eukprot:CAMPEP_0197653210 /NCGR_PEP_ID=MMETSP1338-20131121/34919_1 /TAXON_ID=43686 ORGANISM="Pelagodinium beii, Strain RCC1491" /NCGR_SAMPLE_ID=MMETSP1338 /ASSEMBLY_ACC=CAM_ASM_000754 /LENGTH=119 /DNA_ID=CAMNT_0043228245 /DNA_START=55 /DNA_END=414 /DNA_ORIENTATION=-